MNKILVVVDMQNDFVSGSLGSDDAKAIVGNVVKMIEAWQGEIVCTYDTHYENYLETKEGRMLPVKHCIENTEGWQLCPEVEKALGSKEYKVFRKPTFGSEDLAAYLKEGNYDEIHFVGLCTDICVISNVMLTKAALPESEFVVHADCCAGVTTESHENALNAMKMCHIQIEN